MPPVSSVLEFVGTPEEAHSKLFALGYDLDSDLFVDDRVRFKHRMFDIDTNSTVHYVSTLTDRPYLYSDPYFRNVPTSNLRFDTLAIHRFIQTGGKAVRKATRKGRKAGRKSRRV